MIELKQCVWKVEIPQVWKLSELNISWSISNSKPADCCVQMLKSPSGISVTLVENAGPAFGSERRSDHGKASCSSGLTALTWTLSVVGLQVCEIRSLVQLYPHLLLCSLLKSGTTATILLLLLLLLIIISIIVSTLAVVEQEQQQL